MFSPSSATGGGDGDATAAPRIPNDELMRIATEVVALAPQLPRDGSDLERALLFSKHHPAFWEAYPRLLTMCCSDAAAADPDGFLRQLRFMLDRLSDVDEHRCTEDVASTSVQGMLDERYVAPVVERLPAPDSGPASKRR
jgi:hypothetical protein